MCVCVNGEYSESMLVCARVTLIEQRLKNTRPHFNGLMTLHRGISTLL